MSLSKPLRGVKRKLIGELRDHSYVKKVRKPGTRKCSGRDCNNDNSTHSLFTFPGTSKTIKGQKIECEENIQRYETSSPLFMKF